MREKATKGKSTKKSGGKRKARPTKGRAKRTAAQRASTARGRAKTKKSRAKSQPVKSAGKSAVAGKRKSGKKAGSGKASAKRGGARKAPAPRLRAKRRLTAGAVAAVGSATRSALRAIKGTARRLVRAAGLSHPPRTRRSVHRRGRMAPRSSASAARRVRSAKRGRGSGVPGVIVNALAAPRQNEILTPQAVAFLADLHRKFDARRRALLQARADRRQRSDIGTADSPGDSEWSIKPIPAESAGRRIEIASPADRRAMVTALNSRADCLADCEDNGSAGWPNTVAGHVNLKDLSDGKLDFTDPDSGKRQTVGAKPSLLILRPRSWESLETHLLIDGAPVSASLFDFALHVFHAARTSVGGASPSFQLTRLASHPEAQLWNDVFVFARDKLDLPKNSIKATVLIEALPAFEVTC